MEISQLHREAAGRSVDIWAQSGRYWLDAELVEVRSDSTVWIDEYGTRFSFPTQDLASITYRLHAKGAYRGAGIGLLVSGTAAGLTYLLEPDGGGSGFLALSRRENATLTGLLVGIVAVPIGGLIGGGNGYRVTYRFDGDSESGRLISTACEECFEK